MKEPDIPVCRTMEVLQKKFCTNGHLFKTQKLEVRLRVVPHFSSGIVERAKRERA